jgi:hypothetical protein
MIHCVERWVRALAAVAVCIQPLMIPSSEALVERAVVMILVHRLEHAMIRPDLASVLPLVVAGDLVEAALVDSEVGSAATLYDALGPKTK